MKRVSTFGDDFRVAEVDGAVQKQYRQILTTNSDQSWLIELCFPSGNVGVITLGRQCRLTGAAQDSHQPK